MDCLVNFCQRDASGLGGLVCMAILFHCPTIDRGHMVVLAAGGWNPVTDPEANTLFSSHTVEEIRQIEQKTRY